MTSLFFYARTTYIGLGFIVFVCIGGAVDAKPNAAANSNTRAKGQSWRSARESSKRLSKAIQKHQLSNVKNELEVLSAFFDKHSLEKESTHHSCLPGVKQLCIAALKLCAAAPKGFGMYTPLVAERVPVSGELYIYAELQGVGWLESHGFYRSQIVSDLKVLSPTGEILAEDSGFGESVINARRIHRDRFIVAALNTKGLVKGDYILRYTVHDKISSVSVSANTPFRVP